MIVGSFGSIAFSISENRILTFDDFNRQRSASFNEVARVNDKPTLQFGGVNLDKISMKVYLSSFLGVEPYLEMKRFRKILEEGKEQPLMIGTELIGRFVLESIDESWDIIDNKGRLKTVGLSISLKEYVA